MKVTLIDHTGAGYAHRLGDPPGSYAARLLAFTKNTRLAMTPGGFQEWLLKPWSEIEPELAYMATTIPSSWEFIDATFTLQGITRACAQQITRTRFTPMDGDIFGSYAMQSQRVTDMSDVEVTVPDGLTPYKTELYERFADEAIASYQAMVKADVPMEDARGLLPMNSQCNLVVKYNLRNLAELFRKRESLRVQGEYVEVVRQMRAAIETAWPWSIPFFIPKDHLAISIIEDVARLLPPEQKRQLAKAADLLKL